MTTPQPVTADELATIRARADDWAAGVTGYYPERFEPEEVLRLVAEIERLQDPEAMIDALIKSGWLHTETYKYGDSATVRTTLRYYGQRIIDERPA